MNMPLIGKLLPKNLDEYQDLKRNALFETLVTTDTFKVGDKVFIRDSEIQEVWVIHRFISHHPSQRPAAILIQDDSKALDKDLGALTATTIWCFIDELTF